MKKFLTKFGHIFAALALVFTTLTVNSTCGYIVHQEKLPENAKALRKF